jgi:hypothetical protein
VYLVFVDSHGADQRGKARLSLHQTGIRAFLGNVAVFEEENAIALGQVLRGVSTARMRDGQDRSSKAWKSSNKGDLRTYEKEA